MSDSERQRQFLESFATQYEFYGDTKTAFMGRFDPKHENIQNQHLCLDWRKSQENKAQKLQDELRKNIYPVLQKQDCELPEGPGHSKQKTAYQWLWKTQFPEWEKQNPIEPDTTTPTPETPDWRQICNRLIDKQAQRQKATGRGLGYEKNIDIIPLGLVKPKEELRRKAKNLVDPSQGMQQYQLEQAEIEKRYEHEAFLEEVIGKTGKNLAIIGEPGAGKTTWLTQIAQYLTENQPDSVVIWISLVRWQGKTIDINKYLREDWLMAAVSKPLEPTSQQKQALSALFNSSKVWLLLDGIDEINTTSPLSNIQSFLDVWNNKVRVVLTCRLNVWEANPNALPEFDTYRTLCFDAEGVNEFIRQWFAAAGEVELGEKLWKELATPKQTRLLDLVKNPLRLSLLCKSWKLNPNQSLPHTKAMLYQQFCDDFYVWKRNEFPTSWSQRQELNAGLARLALRAIDENLPLRKPLVYEVLGEAQFKLAEDLGWLNDVYRDTDTPDRIYAFFHATFQEYFAACAINGDEKYWEYFLPRKNDGNNPDLSHPYRIFEKRWREVILFWLGRGDVVKEEKEEKERFIAALVNFEGGCEKFYDDRAYFLAAAGISEFKNFSLADSIIKQLVKWSFGYFDEEQQQWRIFIDSIEKGAREALTQTDSKRAVEQLSHLLRYSHCPEDTRRQVAESLGQIEPGNHQAIIALVDLIATTQNESTRGWTAVSLGKIGKGNTQAINTLIDLITTTQNEFTCWRNEFICWQAAESLEQIDLDNTRAIAALENLATNAQNEDIRLEAAYTLEQIDPGNSQARTTLSDLIVTTQNEFTCWQAASCLEQINPGNTQAIAALGKLVTTTQDEFIRLEVASRLQQIDPGNSQVKIALSSLIETTQNELSRWQAKVTLGQIDLGHRQAKVALGNLITTIQDEYTRMQAAESLGKIEQGNPQAMTTLIDLITDAQDEYTRRKAVESLGKIIATEEQRQEVVSIVQPYLNNETYENNYNLYTTCYNVLWKIAQDLSYRDFYQAWHNNSTTQQSLESQLLNLPQQLQNHEATLLLCLDIHSLLTTADSIEIADLLWQKIHETAFPEATELPPEISRISQLPRYLKQLKFDCNKQYLVLILYDSKSSQNSFSPSLKNVLIQCNNTALIAWLTDSPTGKKLTWIDEV